MRVDFLKARGYQFQPQTSCVQSIPILLDLGDSSPHILCSVHPFGELNANHHHHRAVGLRRIWNLVSIHLLSRTNSGEGMSQFSIICEGLIVFLPLFPILRIFRHQIPYHRLQLHVTWFGEQVESAGHSHLHFR